LQTLGLSNAAVKHNLDKWNSKWQLI